MLDPSHQSSVNPLYRRQADAIRQRAERRHHSDRRQSDRRSGWPDRRESCSEITPRNVMELLVEEEIENQLRSLSEKQRSAVKRPQVMAYALNRLPSLYVTSAKGWRQQWVHGKGGLQKEIEMAVRRSIIAVQQDPLRVMSPVNDYMPEMAEAPMAQLRMLLQEPTLNWGNLVPTIQHLLIEGKMEFPERGNGSSQRAGDRPSSAVEQVTIPTPALLTDWANGELDDGDSSDSDDSFDWDSHPLHQRS